MIKVGFLGCGRIASHYKKQYLAGLLGELNVTACVDTDLGKATALASELRAKPYSSIDEMLKKEPLDLVIVMTPSGMHFEHALYLLRNNQNILVEKPPTMSVKQLDILEQEATSRGIFAGVCFQNRFNPAVSFLKNLISQKAFGKIISFSVRLRWCRYQDYYDDGWHGTWKMDGGVLNQQAIHHVDALGWLLGCVDEVFAFSTRRLNSLEAEDTIVVSVRLADGALGTLEATTAARPDDIEASFTLVGENGYAEIGGIALNSLEKLVINGRAQEKLESYTESVENGYGNGHVALLNTVAKIISTGAGIEESLSISSSKNTLRLVHSIYSSAERNQAIKLSDNFNSKKLGV